MGSWLLGKCFVAHFGWGLGGTCDIFRTLGLDGQGNNGQLVFFW